MKTRSGFNRIIFFSLLLVVSILITSAVQAQSVNAAGDPTSLADAQLPPETSISSDGQSFQAPEFSLSIKGESGFAGTNYEGNLTSRVALSEKKLPPISSLFPESVIGADGRTRITPTTGIPSKRIVFLKVTFPSGSGTCSGFFYGPRIVATAGHCVYNKTYGGWAKSITVYPGRNGSLTPYGSTTAHRLFSNTSWTGSSDPNADYGAIQTHSALGNTVGYFGYYWQASNTFSGSYIVRGYPGDKTYGTMWTMSGAVSNVTTSRLWYSMDTAGGQSGSPFYKNHPTYGWAAAAIHTYGVPLSPYTTKNSATRITSGRFNLMKSWKNYAYP